MQNTGNLNTLQANGRDDEIERVFRPLPRMVLEANMNPQDLASARKLAEEDFRAYWEQAALDLEWFEKWEQVLDDSQAPRYRWFAGGKCNIVHNALDRHIRTVNRNKLALVWEGEPGDSRKYTYFELYRAVNRLANALRNLGIRKGERIVLYMPPLPETVIAMLAAAKIGAVHVVVFAGFSGKALRERIQATNARCIITADGFYRNGKFTSLKPLVDAALAADEEDNVDVCVVVRRAGIDVNMTAARDIWYDDLVRREANEAETEIMDSNDPLFILHTSGTSGKPRGIIHSHGGYMTGVADTIKSVFDIKPTDFFWCTADAGWITGHSAVVYGPLIAGTTTLMYEGHPLYPQADRMWNMVDKYGVSILYTTPTTIRMLMRYGNRFPAQHDLSSLRLLGTVGEAISPETWVWFHKTIGRNECQLIDTWWQTETGQFMISPLPVSPLKPGSVNKPLPGVSADVVDRKGKPKPTNEVGFLAITKPWPAMFTGVLGDEATYDEYFNTIPGVYFAGDVARKDEDGHFWMLGRADEVLNIAGHRLGAVELEAVLCSHKTVAEAAVIGVPDKIKGETAKAFVVPGPNDQICEDPTTDARDAALTDELRQLLRQELGPVAELRSVVFCESLPKTRSGKILRRVLKAQELGQDIEDITVIDEE
ncbi:MAG: acetate--CoA ligase [Desulfovibrio sp.]|uniref:acetate--CoA ligase n=1 Tax=Desulfovibrio sp. 7SRBS1 TaxID=3378064 RepID=UPI003B404FD9